MPIKWVMFGMFLWLGMTIIAGLFECAWVSDIHSAKLVQMWDGMSVLGWANMAVTGIGLATTGVLAAIAGNRFFTAVSVIFCVAFLYNFKDILTFDYAIFYGPYEIVRWIFMLIGLVIFAAVAITFFRGVSSS